MGRHLTNQITGNALAQCKIICHLGPYDIQTTPSDLYIICLSMKQGVGRAPGESLPDRNVFNNDQYALCNTHSPST